MPYRRGRQIVLFFARIGATIGQAPWQHCGMIGRRTVAGAAVLAAGLVGCLVAPGQTGDTVPFPKGYRHWVYIHSMFSGLKNPTFVKQPCEKPCIGGIFHFYANEKAMEGYRTGKFPDGSVLADELLEISGQDVGSAKEGPRRGIGVMVKDSQRYSATGGWGFEAFEPPNEAVGTLSAEEKKACFTCHVARKDHDFVFTEFHEP
jgi:hypothetical protein